MLGFLRAIGFAMLQFCLPSPASFNRNLPQRDGRQVDEEEENKVGMDEVRRGMREATGMKTIIKEDKTKDKRWRGGQKNRNNTSVWGK